MRNIDDKDVLFLDELIHPQRIKVMDDGVYIFDKINLDECRLYKYDNNFDECELVFDIDGDLCAFGTDGNTYIARNDESTEVIVYSCDGEKIRSVPLPGTACLLEVDEAGRIYVLLMDEKGMYVNIYDRQGQFIHNIHSRDLQVLTALMYDEDGAYLGGFSSDSKARVEKVNWVSYIDSSFDIDIPSKEYIISRMIRWNSSTVAALMGPKGNFVFFINDFDTEKKIIKLPIDSAGSISDIFIKDGMLYVLNEKGSIIKYDIEEVYNSSNNMHTHEKEKRYSISRNRCFRYISWFKNFPKNFTKSFLKIAVPLALLLMIAWNFILKSSMESQKGGYLRSVFIMSLVLCLGVTVYDNIMEFVNCRTRVDSMLDIYNNIDKIKFILIGNSIFIGLLVSSVLYFTDHRVLAMVSMIIGSIIFFATGWGILGKIKSETNDIVFDLLSLGDDNHELFKKIRSKVREIGEEGVEIYSIKADLCSGIGKRTAKLIERWAALRSNVTGGKFKLKNANGQLEFELDLKCRNIRYSKLTVIEDFICYIGSNLNLSSITIEPIEDNLP